jgi:nucleoside-diphosphate-sugar epimerase
MNLLKELSGVHISVVGMGYIGRRLFNFLEQNSEAYNYKVSAFSKSNIEDIRFKEFDYLFNCAGNTGDFRDKIFETAESNLLLTSFLIQNIKIRKAYVAISSTRVYGFLNDKDVLFTEEYNSWNHGSHLGIDFVYDGTKKLLESMLWNSRNERSFRTVICRLSNLYGGYQMNDLNDSTFLKVMVKHAISKTSLKLNQNINNSKGYIHIDDAVEGLLAAAVFSDQSNIFNLCSGVSYSLEDWLKYLGVSFELCSYSTISTHSKNDISRAKKLIYFNPKYFLSNLSLNKIINYESS